VLAGLGGILVWQIVTRSFAAYLALEAPAAALELQPGEPTALVRAADNTLNPRVAEAAEAAEGAAGTVARQVLDERSSPSDENRLGGLSELALKAAAAKLPLDAKQAAPATGKAADSALSEQDRAQIRAQAEQALVEDPLNAQALRILGQLAVGAGDETRAAKLMRAAADRSLGESVAVYWMMQHSLKDKDYAQTVAYADTFLRKRPQFVQHAIPLLDAMAESGDKAAVDALQKKLAQDPPWRQRFFAQLPGHSKDARTPLNLLLSIKGTAAPPSAADLGPYLSFLVNNKLYELAYYTWLQFLPADVLGRIGFLDNGDFEDAPSGLPFDWVITPGAGVSIDIAERPDTADAHALLLELGPGRADFGGVSQLLLLTPGKYQLKGKIKGELRGKRGLQWSIDCAGGGPSLGEAPMFVGLAPTWTDFDITFTVPEEGCRAQELRLALAARSASEQLVSGSVWYDDLQIKRAADAGTSTP